VKHSTGLFVGLLVAVTYAGAATSPSVHIVSPIVVNSGSPNTGLWSGSSPMHLVAYADSTDCPSGINAIQVYVADGVLAYQTYSTYLAETSQIEALIVVSAAASDRSTKRSVGLRVQAPPNGSEC
jgi:hypothetical protein